jgi:putative FmdB family regulatory protein
MPIYEYECGRCRCRFEMKQGFDEEPQASCPRCQGMARRIFYPAPVIFKGSGFYITDSRKGKDPEASHGEADKSHRESGKGKTETGKGEIAKTETKTEKGK